MEAVDETWQRGLCVVAHPDDLEYGAAAAVARWTGQGKAMAYALVTSGEAGIDGLHPDECRTVREDEERRSAAVVGVRDVRFLGHPDGLVVADVTLRRDIAAAIRWWRPDVVVTMNHELTWFGPNVNHADHRAAGLATLDACRDAANRWLFADAGEPWAGVHDVYVFASDRPTHFVDVTDTIAAGVASLREHRAYIDGLGTEFDPDTFLRGNAEAAGRDAGVPAAVTFELLHV